MDFYKMHSNEIRFVIGLENILFEGMCMHFSAQKFYGLEQWRG